MTAGVRGASGTVLLAAIAIAAGAGAPDAFASGATGATGSSGATGASGSSGASGSTAPNPSVSSNWSGYAAQGTHGVRHFKSASADWVQPAATCRPGSATYSAFWVGLGGMSASATRLEQAGTEADCAADGSPSYYGWYELVPHAPVRLRLPIAVGDRIAVTVTVANGSVSIHMRDRTRGTSISKRLRFSDPDTSSAEWIAEAPSTCAPNGECSALPLSDFGAVTFTGARATTKAGHAGAIASANWGSQAIELEQVLASPGFRRFVAARELVTAAPSALNQTGSSFTVDWGEQQSTAPIGGGHHFPGEGP